MIGPDPELEKAVRGKLAEVGARPAPPPSPWPVNVVAAALAVPDGNAARLLVLLAEARCRLTEEVEGRMLATGSEPKLLVAWMNDGRGRKGACRSRLTSTASGEPAAAYERACGELLALCRGWLTQGEPRPLPGGESPQRPEGAAGEAAGEVSEEAHALYAKIDAYAKEDKAGGVYVRDRAVVRVIQEALDRRPGGPPAPPAAGAASQPGADTGAGAALVRGWLADFPRGHAAGGAPLEALEARVDGALKVARAAAHRSGAASQAAPRKNDSRPVWDLVVEDMKARDAVGRQRYGTPLQARNGRNALLDAYHEALDLAVYLRQALEEWPPGASDERAAAQALYDAYRSWPGTVAGPDALEDWWKASLRPAMDRAAAVLRPGG